MIESYDMNWDFKTIIGHISPGLKTFKFLERALVSGIFC